MSVDLETFSTVDLAKCGVFRYSEGVDLLLFAYAFDDDPVVVIDIASGEQLPDEVMDALWNGEVIKYAFNAQFEITCLEKYFGVELKVEQWRCTMIEALYMGLPSKMEMVSEVLGVSQKDKEGKDLIKYFSVLQTPSKANGGRIRNLPHHNRDKWKRFMEYNAQDVVVERDIRKRLEKYPVPMNEWKLWWLDQKINKRGVKIDLDLVKNAIDADVLNVNMVMDEMINLTGLTNPNSAVKIKEWIGRMEGLKVDSLDKDHIDEVIEACNTDVVKRVLELRKENGKTSVAKYETMLRCVNKDDRLRGLVQFYGANRSGRWAGRLVQVHNLPKNKRKDLDTVRKCLKLGMYESISAEALSELIRTMFVPREGHKLVVADFSAIEARVIAWMAGEKWRMDVFAGDGKIYEASASKMFGVPVESIGKGSELRQKGKIAELALGYQGGVGALKKMGALDMGLKEEELQGLVDAWRRANDKIVQLWYEVQRRVVEAICDKKVGKMACGVWFEARNGMLFIHLPSGRHLSYVKPSVEVVDGWKTDISYWGMNQETKQWVKTLSYGGKFVENIVQAIARDCLAVAMQRLDRAGYEIVMHVHDEVIIEVKEPTKIEGYLGVLLDGEVEEICEVMGQEIEWAKGLKLGAEGFWCDYYKKE